jgi:acyl-coenzyme A thioesterase PaaI-like protein
MSHLAAQNDIVTRLNNHHLEFIKLLGGQVVAVDPEARSCTFTFNVSLDFCHSGNIVQGGFVSAMLDAAMSHAVFGCAPDVERLSSLEITTRYESVTRGESVLTVTGWIRRMTRTIAFLEADVKSESGEILAVAHSVAKIGRKV